MTRPSDGVAFTFAVPMSKRFQTGITYTFSNKEEAEFEINGTYMGSGSQMDEDIGFIMANSSSSGRLTMQAQQKISALGMKSSAQVEMASADPQQSHIGFTLQKDFANSHVQYQYQGYHALNYMQGITRDLIAGFSFNYIVSNKS